ncbi:major capsid protein, partial [Enterococcus casseliflavus]|uniref:major capsid protein n=1 Tax=Enterococcus casseliflavus TaxID=37734 RepID=UPI003D12B8F8
VLAQQVQLFNSATRGGIVLRTAAHQGDFSDTAFYQKISGLVKRRNAYGSGSVSEKILEHLLDTSVKVAAGTPPVRIDPHWFQWI